MVRRLFVERHAQEFGQGGLLRAWVHADFERWHNRRAITQINGDDQALQVLPDRAQVNLNLHFGPDQRSSPHRQIPRESTFGTAIRWKLPKLLSKSVPPAAPSQIVMSLGIAQNKSRATKVVRLNWNCRFQALRN